ncbi:MAG TPA: hypothetical protein VFM83_01310 [Gaiellaceae bacterium]|nr:hypothetical protein [Gaiellaceae bacterium]
MPGQLFVPTRRTDPNRKLGRFIGPRRDYRCEICQGWGTVPVYGKDGLDPYLIPQKG